MTPATAGDVLTQAPPALVDGLHAFPLADGTYLVVDPASPVPQRVQAGIEEQAKSTIPDVTDVSDQSQQNAASQALIALDDFTRTAAGRSVVVTQAQTQIVSADTGSTATVWVTWLRHPSTGATAAFAQGSAESSVAAATSWLKESGLDPEDFVFVAN